MVFQLCFQIIHFENHYSCALTNQQIITPLDSTSWKHEKKRELQIRLIDISKLGTALGMDVCEVLVGVHAWTESDSVSSFAARKGKSR